MKKKKKNKKIQRKSIIQSYQNDIDIIRIKN